MVKFKTRISDSSVSLNIRKVVTILLLISAIAFILVKVVLFLPIPQALKPIIFSQTPAFAIAFLIGISCFVVIYFVLTVTDRYVKTTVTVDEDLIYFKQESKERKLFYADIIEVKEPDFMTKKHELELLMKENRQFIRFSSSYQMEQFKKLINNKIEAIKPRK